MIKLGTLEASINDILRISKENAGKTFAELVKAPLQCRHLGDLCKTTSQCCGALRCLIYDTDAGICYRPRFAKNDGITTHLLF